MSDPTVITEDRVEVLTKRIAELEADAARMDWLEAYFAKKESQRPMILIRSTLRSAVDIYRALEEK